MTTKNVSERLIGSEGRDAMASGKYELLNAARALLFGKLLDVAIPTVQHYRSDFYHDADWIRNHCTYMHNVFYFGFREWGTSIGRSYDHVEQGNDVMLKVMLWLETSEFSGSWHYSFEQVKGK